MQAGTLFLLPLKIHLIALYVFFSNFSVCDTYDLMEQLVELLQKEMGFLNRLSPFYCYCEKKNE